MSIQKTYYENKKEEIMLNNLLNNISTILKKST